ncbi:class II fumarate hydratase, partial [Paenibacillus sepulcri]|nr:class II fumarate hydratase [Paenibacillus sepulcri]
MEFRTEKDSMGEIQVPADRLWGAQTERSLNNFKIGTEKMPVELISAFAYLKKGAALVNKELGKLDAAKALAISDAADEIIAGKWTGEFPLAVWQTGSGTQSNMNVNEVIARRAGQLLAQQDAAGDVKIHPNDDVNRSQSSNDTFPTAMHLAALITVEDTVLPAIARLKATLQAKSEAFADVIKIGRTHL